MVIVRTGEKQKGGVYNVYHDFGFGKWKKFWDESGGG